MSNSPKSASPDETPWWKIVFWTLAFQIAWNWRSLGPVLREGELVGPDDFLRMHQVHNFLSGQGWFDMRAYRMFPPEGADIHWSRLVDVPIAALIWLFEWFTGFETAWRLAAIVWPTLLAIATVWVLVLICDQLIDRYNRLLPLLFSVLCTSSIAEFVPGRVDHHNVQILLFTLVMLGLVLRPSLKGNLLIGGCIALSIAIGLDAAIVLVPILAYVGFEWAWGTDRDGRGLRQVGIAMAISALGLYAISFSPQDWWAARCDANSLFYLAALVLVSVAFLALSGISSRFNPETNSGRIYRLAAGVLAGAIAVGLLLFWFPQCVEGPFAKVGPELKSRWLSNIDEAKGLFAAAAEKPSLWFSMAGYAAVMAIVATWVTIREARRQPRLIVLLFTLIICIAAMFLQVRALRVGIYVAIPFCVIAAMRSWQWLEARLPGNRVLTSAMQVVIVIIMLSASWQFAGSQFEARSKASGAQQTSQQTDDAAEPSLQAAKAKRPGFCNQLGDYHALNTLPAGLVMSSLNVGSAILVHTPHQVVGGNYHRNEKAILSALDFFQTDTATAKTIADEMAIDYVALCPKKPLGKLDDKSSEKLIGRIIEDQLPPWLDWVSPPSDKLKVLRVVPVDG